MKSTSGCTFFFYDYDDPSGSWQKQHKWTWTGACSGGVATGSGDLTAVMSYDTGETYTSGYRGTMVGGRLNGRVEEITNGKMPAAYYWQTFEMGCGTAEQFVYCLPYTGAAPPPPKQPAFNAATAPSVKTLVAAADAVIRADLNAASEDRILAVLTELVQTGKIDVARQANVILARRFPNSPLLASAMTLFDAWERGDFDAPEAAAAAPAATPKASVPSTPAATTSPNVSAATLGIEDIRRLVEAEFGPIKDISGASTKIYEVTLNRGGYNVPLSIELSGSGKFVWVSANVRDSGWPADKAALALRRITQIQPTMIWDSGTKIRFGTAIENRALTQSVLKEAIERVANDVANNADVWQ